MKTLKILLIALVVVTASACSKKLISSTSTTKTTERIDSVERDVTFKTKPKDVNASGSLHAKIDTKVIFVPGQKNTVIVEKNGIKYLTKYNNDSTLILKAQIDSLGNYQLECIETGETLKAKIKTAEKTITTVTKEKEVYEKRTTFLEKLVRIICAALAILVIAAIILFALYRKAKQNIPLL